MAYPPAIGSRFKALARACPGNGPPRTWCGAGTVFRYGHARML